MQQGIRVYRTLEKGLTDSGVVTLLIVRKRELVELLVQAYKFIVVALRHGAQFSLIFLPGADEAKHKAAPQGT